MDFSEVKIKELSVFLPAYNEEKNIKKTIANVYETLPSLAKNFEVIVINDGSSDRTLEILKELKLKNLSIINHIKNQGYGAGVISGLYNSKYELIFFMDSDGQFNFSEITSMIKRQKETNADLVIGQYINRKVSKARKLNTFLWQLVIRIMFNLKVKHIDCGFKLIRKKVIDEIPKLESQRGAFISTEFLVKAKSKKFKIVEIPVHHFERKEGVATGNNFKVIINSFRDLFKLRKELNKNGRI
jgi:glycosyltransferase involved in cell wall biosynthesis